MLKEVYKAYRNLADEINWKQYNCNDLFRNYIENEDTQIAENWFAAIVCRYWGYAGRIYTQCNRHVTFEDCHDCIIDAIRYVLDKRVWENEDNSLYNDPTGPDKAMHIAMKRQKAILLSKLSTHKRIANFNTLSIDGAKEDYHDSAEGLLFDVSQNNSDNELKLFISSAFFKDKNSCIDGLLLDLICYNGTSETFNIKSTIKDLKKLTMKDYDYYNSMYTVDKNLFKEALRTIYYYSNALLEIKLKSLLHRLKEDMYD